MLLVALLGIAINTGSALLFMKSQKHDLNAKGAYLHMAADAAVSGAVVVAAAAIIFTGWQWLDPAVAIVVSALIAVTAWSLMRDALPRYTPTECGHYMHHAGYRLPTAL